MLALAPACDSDEPACLPSPPSRHVVTADWLNRSLTVLSYDHLSDDRCDPAEGIVSTIDLSAYSPGPLEVELAANRTAVVSIGPGFFEGAGGALIGSPAVPAGGTLLVVDLSTGDVVFEIATAHVPMGIAIGSEGRRAYTANFGTASDPGTTMSIVDLETGTIIDELDVGSSPEQVSLSPDGSLGCINLAGDGAVRVFSTSDPRGTLSAPIPTGDDPSDVVFVDDQRVLVTNSQEVTLSLIDVSEPLAPVVIESARFVGGFPYGATRVPGTQKAIITAYLPYARLVPVDLATNTVSVGEWVDLPGTGLPLVSAIDPEGRFAFVPHPTDQVLSIVDLESFQIRSMSWLTGPGPTYVAVEP